jgi:hypothetical protein
MAKTNHFVKILEEIERKKEVLVNLFCNLGQKLKFDGKTE